MIGLDTNLLVRYIVRDDTRQAQLASSYIKKKRDDGVSMFINHIVLCEIVWVLESTYEYSKTQIVNVLEKILDISQFSIPDVDSVVLALSAYKNSKVGFSDALIGTTNKMEGCVKTATFDKYAGKLPDFELLG